MKQSTCVYLIQNGRWLMLLRNRKQHDVNEGKWIGVGGKNEPCETYLDCARREVFEETGLTMQEVSFRGFVDFHYDTLEAERIAIYTSETFDGVLNDCDEGTLAWIHESELMDLSLWEGDKIFLQRLLKRETTPFYLILYYDDEGTLIRFEECRDVPAI